jgi:nicotinamide-nucleotide amidase
MAEPIVHLLITGSELTRGETRDINGSFLAAALTTLGFRVEEARLLPDDPVKLEAGFRESIDRADLVVASGGLGPTSDDHTVRVLARVLGRRVIEDPEARRRMRERVLARVGSEDRIPSNYFKQAEVVEGAQVLLNPVGLAPGSLVETRRGFAAVMPGVPRELRGIFRELVVPEIRRRLRLEAPRIYRAKLLGLAESIAESRIQALGIDFERIEYGISAKPGELLVKFISHTAADHPLIDQVRERLEKEFGEALVPVPEGLLDSSGEAHAIEHSRLAHDALIASGATVATAESCTGGLIAEELTEHPGSSAYFLGAVVAYQNAVKARLLGVDPRLLAEHGAVSEEVCRALAIGARERFGATFGIGVTGIAGPDGGSAEKPVGLVYIGLASPDGVVVERHVFWGWRQAVRQQAAVRGLEMLRRKAGGWRRESPSGKGGTTASPRPNSA